MKSTHKKISALLLLPILFFALHYFVFLGHYNSPFDGNESFPDWFILVSTAPTPIISENIVLVGTPSEPNYLHPLRYKYMYINAAGHLYFETRKYIVGDFNFYDTNIDQESLLRDFTVNDIPNGLFFLTQYMLIIAFVWQVIKARKFLIK